MRSVEVNAANVSSQFQALKKQAEKVHKRALELSKNRSGLSVDTSDAVSTISSQNDSVSVMLDDYIKKYSSTDDVNESSDTCSTITTTSKSSSLRFEDSIHVDLSLLAKSLSNSCSDDTKSNSSVSTSDLKREASRIIYSSPILSKTVSSTRSRPGSASSSTTGSTVSKSSQRSKSTSSRISNRSSRSSSSASTRSSVVLRQKSNSKRSNVSLSSEESRFEEYLRINRISKARDQQLDTLYRTAIEGLSHPAIANTDSSHLKSSRPVRPKIFKQPEPARVIAQQPPTTLQNYVSQNIIRQPHIDTKKIEEWDGWKSFRTKDTTDVDSTIVTDDTQISHVSEDCNLTSEEIHQRYLQYKYTTSKGSRSLHTQGTITDECTEHTSETRTSEVVKQEKPKKKSLTQREQQDRRAFSVQSSLPAPTPARSSVEDDSIREWIRSKARLPEKVESNIPDLRPQPSISNSASRRPSAPPPKNQIACRLKEQEVQTEYNNNNNGNTNIITRRDDVHNCGLSLNIFGENAQALRRVEVSLTPETNHAVCTICKKVDISQINADNHSDTSSNSSGTSSSTLHTIGEKLNDLRVSTTSFAQKENIPLNSMDVTSLKDRSSESISSTLQPLRDLLSRYFVE